MSALLSAVTKRLSTLPMLWAVVAPFSLQLTATAAICGWLSWRAGEQSVQRLVDQLSQKTASTVTEHVRLFADTPYLILQTDAQAVKAGLLSLENFTQLQAYFWQQIQLFDGFKTIYYGNQAGDFLLVQTDPEPLLYRRDPTTAPQRQIFRLNGLGNIQEWVRQSEFDPRQRPWYEAALQARQPTWSPIYVFAARPVLGITATAPIYDPDDQLLGVMGIDLTLQQISDFLQRLKIGETGQSFIIERTGELVATSIDEPPFLRTPGGQERMPPTASSDPITRAIAVEMARRFDLATLQGSQQWRLTVAGERQFVQITPLPERGLNWLLVVVIPEQEFLAEITANLRATVGICTLALLIALTVGFITSRALVRPLQSLQTAAATIVDGSLSQRIPETSLIGELRQLAVGFNRMSGHLSTAFAQLQTLNSHLEEQVTQRTAELQQALSHALLLSRLIEKTRHDLDETLTLSLLVEELVAALELVFCEIWLMETTTPATTQSQEALVLKYSQYHGLSSGLPPDGLISISGRNQPPNYPIYCCWQGSAKFTVVICPIIDQQGLMGILVVGRGEHQSFSTIEIHLMEQLANQSAIAIRQSRLYQGSLSQVTELEQLNRLKDDFMATVSHELKTPLNNIRMGVELLRMDQGNASQQRYIDIVMNEVDRELELVNNLLDLQRSEAGQIEIFVECKAVQPWLERLLEVMSLQTIAKEQKITATLSQPEKVWCTDHQRFERVIRELLSNAIKYTDPQQEIQVELTVTESLLTVKVSNPGDIQPQQIPRLFTKFYRIPEADRWKHGGTGLGLALVKQFVLEMKGEIRVVCDHNQVSFIVGIPNLDLPTTTT
ncbi:MAG: cache domain-containing protein [Cyanobacteriota bacterium]|nr:cache domain-containing protein [Cyanobacteriota bacterium]